MRKWTKEKPKKVGWYGYKCENKNITGLIRKSIVEVVEDNIDSSILKVVLGGYIYKLEEMEGEWTVDSIEL